MRRDAEVPPECCCEISGQVVPVIGCDHVDWGVRKPQLPGGALKSQLPLPGQWRQPHFPFEHLVEGVVVGVEHLCQRTHRDGGRNLVRHEGAAPLDQRHP